MTRVWPIDALDGRDILAEWMLTHPTGGNMMIRLWDGNQTVCVYLADALPLPTVPDSSTDYLHGFRRVVDEILPGYTAAGWVLDESFLADDIAGDDAEFSPVSCPSCGFEHPWWNGAEESCRICDTAIDLDWLPYDANLNGKIQAGEYDSARNLLRDLSHTLATGEQLLTELPEGEQRTNITALMGPARAAHRGATARLRAALALPTVQAATEAATPAVLAVIAHGTDVAGWLAGVLAVVAAQLGSVDTVTANRPGSWEADLVHRLVAGTVGWDDEHLDDYLPVTTPSAGGQDDDEAEGLPAPLATFPTAGGAAVNVAVYPLLPNTFSTICTACGPRGLHSYLPELKDAGWQTAVDDASWHAEACTKEADQ